MMQTIDVETFALSLAMAAAAGLVGAFAVMRRMALASDAISHVALPGIGVALALNAHPLLGAGAMLLAGTLLIWALQRRTRMPTETVIGVVFSSALAAGSLMASGDELLDALLGTQGALRSWEVALGFAGALGVVAFMIAERHRLVVALVSPDVARTAGVKVARLDLLYLAAFALTVALGLRYLGVLLMGSLVIIPAATAKQLARSLDGMLALACALSVASTAVGYLAADALHRPTGPVIIVTSACFFFLSLLARPRR